MFLSFGARTTSILLGGTGLIRVHMVFNQVLDRGSKFSDSLQPVHVTQLSSIRDGCCIDDKCVNSISYADDIVLLCASAYGLRRLVGVYDRYASAHGLVYNVKKNIVMCYWACGTRSETIPPIMMIDLGYVLTCGDDDEIERQNGERCRSKRILF